MNWAFLANSAIQSIEDINLYGYQKITLFCEDTEVINFNFSKLPTYCSVEYVQFDSNNPNSLEVSIAYQVGLSNAKEDKGIDFVIISNNRALESICDTIHATGRNCTYKSKMNDEIDLRTAAENIVRHILMSFPDGRMRPRSASVLEGWINFECQALTGNIEPSLIIRVFWDSEIIKENVNGISYQLSNPIHI